VTNPPGLDHLNESIAQAVCCLSSIRTQLNIRIFTVPRTRCIILPRFAVHNSMANRVVMLMHLIHERFQCILFLSLVENRRTFSTRTEQRSMTAFLNAFLALHLSVWHEGCRVLFSTALRQEVRKSVSKNLSAHRVSSCL
jgi:hypothetical protein